MFRRATFEDGVFILRLAREFFHESWGAGYGIPFDPESAMRSLDAVIENGIMLVGESSYAGAIITPCLWNNDYQIATVMTWYFKRPREVKIFEALMNECREAGATHFVSASIEPKHTVAKLYARSGLRPVETQHICRL